MPLLWKIVWLLNIVTVWLSSSLPRCILERNEDRYPHKNLYMNVHSIVIQNSNKVHELRKNFQMYKLDIEKAEEPEVNLSNICWIIEKEEIKKNLLLLHWLHKALDWVDHSKLWKILQEMGIPDYLTCFLRNLYAGQEVTFRTDM